MSPRAFDPEIIAHRLAEIRRLLRFLADRDTDGAELRRDLGTALAVERALQVIVELATTINVHVVVSHGREAPRDYRGSFRPMHELGVIDADLAVELEPSAGLRNVLVHEYLAIDHDIVAASCADAIDRYGRYVDQVAGWLQTRPEGPERSR